MLRTTRATRSALPLVLAAAFAACADLPTGPEVEADPSVTPSFLIGNSPLFLADPRPSPSTGGLVVDLDVSQSIFGKDVNRYAFRTSAVLTFSDGSTAVVDPKVNDAATSNPKMSAGFATVSIILPFSRPVFAKIAGARSAIPTEIVSEVIDIHTGAVLDRVATKTSVDF